MKFKVTVKGHSYQTGKLETKFIELTDRELDRIYEEGEYSPTLAFQLGLVNAYINGADPIR